MKHMLAEAGMVAEGPGVSPEDLRDLYLRESEQGRKRVTRQGLWIAVAAYLAYSITDYLFIGDVAYYTVAGRLIVGVSALVFLEVLIYFEARSGLIDAVAATAVSVAYLAWIITAQMSSAVEALSYYMVFGAIFMMSVNLFFSFRFPLALMASTVNMLIFLGMLYTFSPMLPLYKLILGAFCISCFVFTSYVNLKLNRERYNVFLNALEARVQQNEADERGKALLRLSNTDSLTGLENRRAVDERLRDYWQRWLDHRSMFYVLLLDVDYFKRYNDRYGHQEGDRCLVAVSHLLQDVVSSHGARIARYGGEEFIIIAQQHSVEDAIAFAEAIKSAIRALALPHENRRDGTTIVTVSIGLSFPKNLTKQLDRVVHEADLALYAAKKRGRNTVVVFDPSDAKAQDDEEDIAAILKVAVDQRLVSLVYQPIRNVQSGRVAAAEALMRLRRPDGTSIAPVAFIPVAERSGAIIELGRWAIRTVCSDLLAENKVEVASVNVSPIELKSPDFPSFVASTLADFSLAGARLALEITEGIELELDQDVVLCITDLRKLGVQVWLDDFGTGFAGLSWLRLIEFDTVKIDRSFLHDCNTERGRRMMVDIIGLLRNRGIRVVVEGVETIEHQRLMQQYGIHQLQGYYLGRPDAADQLQSINVLPFDIMKSRVG